MSTRQSAVSRLHQPSRTGSRRPSPIDLHVGKRIRLKRTALGLTQSSLAEQMGITFQQLQKYERGDNRVSSSRLFDLSRVLGVPCSFFFGEMASCTVGGGLQHLNGLPRHSPEEESSDDVQREALDLVRIYLRIGSRHLRQHFVCLVRAIARLNDGLE